jgi:hypothetical protein
MEPLVRPGHHRHRTPTGTTRWLAAFGGALALLAGGCGGGSDTPPPDSLVVPADEELGGSECPLCRAGVLSGVAGSGGALAHARITAFDAAGRHALANADAQGRFELDASALQGTLLVQAIGREQGRPVRLHAVVRAPEVGRRALAVTPLTELIVAFALGGRPHERLEAARVDFLRLETSALRAAEARVEALVRPLLDAAGVPEAVDLRLSAMPTDGTGLDRALHTLELQWLPRAYRLRHLAMAAEEGIVVDPAAGASAPVFAPLSPPQAAALERAHAARPALHALLAGWQQALAGGLPVDDAALLAPIDASAFRHQGLDAAAYVQRVLRRQDAPDAGGHTLVGATFGAPRVLEAQADGRLRIRFEVLPRGGAFTSGESMWVAPRAGGWALQGDAAAAAVHVRPLLMLGPAPLPAADVLALPGVVCEAALWAGCIAEGDGVAAPVGGRLELGLAGDPVFGTFALYRAHAGTAEQRIEATAAASRSLGRPSAQVQSMLAFEVDAVRIDPRARQVRVTGPGLPTSGLVLVPPAAEAGHATGAPGRHWVLASAPEEDWSAVGRGDCTHAADAAAREGCSLGWSELADGSEYRFHVQGEGGTDLGTLATRVQGLPAATAEAFAAFARWSLADLPVAQPSLANLLRSPTMVDGLALAWPWSAPPGAFTSIAVELEWHRATWPAGDATNRQRFLWTLAAAAPGGAVPPAGTAHLAVASRPGWRTHWLVARLVATDPLGVQRVHWVSPANPH